MDIFVLMFVSLAYLFLAAAFVSLYEGHKWTACICAFTSFSVAASASMAVL